MNDLYHLYLLYLFIYKHEYDLDSNSWLYILGVLNPLNAELNPIFYLLALLGAHHILHVSRIRVNKIKSDVHFVCSHLLSCNLWNDI